MERSPSPPVVMSHVGGPVDAFELLQSPTTSTPLSHGPGNTAARHGATSAASLAPSHLPSSSPPPALSSVRSNPTLLPSRQPGRPRVKDMARSFEGNDPNSSASAATRDKYHTRRPAPASARNGRKSPGKLQKSPSVETVNMRGYSHGTQSSRRAKSPGKHAPNSRPLFGEITADGKWKGNFDLGDYGPLPAFAKAPRRGSEGSLALNQGRSASHQDMSAPSLGPSSKHKLNHKRSRSDMDALKPSTAPSMPNLHNARDLEMHPIPPDPANRHTRSRVSPAVSRIPISSRRQSSDSTASSNGHHSRAPSAMSNPPARRRPDRSPSRTGPAKGKENYTPPASRNRYHPPPISTSQPGQTLSAKIVPPMPKTSPPLRSSRPRQPVSAATTAASRARAAERSQGPPREGRRPSEQWLGKPYDPHKERSKRKIPELDKINFEERRARIQRAISQSLKSTASQESVRSQSRSVSRGPLSRSLPQERGQAGAGSEEQGTPDGGKRQHENHDETAHSMDTDASQHPVLSVDTAGIADTLNAEPAELTSQTKRTTFFEDESPVLGRPDMETDAAPSGEAPILLAPATYQPPHKVAAPVPQDEESTNHVSSVQEPPTTILDNVLRMRERSESSASQTGTEFADDSPSAEDSPSDLGENWGFGNGWSGDQGSIRIMLDDGPRDAHHTEPWLETLGSDRNHVLADGNASQTQEYNHHAFAANSFLESPVEEPDEFPEDSAQVTPRKSRDDTLKPAVYQPSSLDGIDGGGIVDADAPIERILHHYQSTGSLTAEMLQQAQHHMVDLHRISANGGSNAIMVQSLLDSIMGALSPETQMPSKQMLNPAVHDLPLVTPDTPPLDGSFEPGTVVVYGNDMSGDSEEDGEDFEAKIRKADEEWERQHRGESMLVHHDEEEVRPPPPPPPKDIGYTPRSSVGPTSATFLPNLTDGGLRISTTGPLELSEIQSGGELAELTSPDRSVASPLASTAAPPLPAHAPPPPPAPPVDSAVKSQFTLPDLTAAEAYSENASIELSPRFRKNYASGSSRPSMDSQRQPMQAASQTMTSFAESTRQASIDTAAESNAKLAETASTGPEHKRLLKRRHIIRELLDTENSYHQDLKIIEDIYKATCTPELVAPEDKKVLFGNCDEVERFALHFYDELRRASTQVYVPPKQHRWTNKRSSFSTTQSDNTMQTTSTLTDAVDEERDRTTTVGATFLANLPEMEKIYGAYLKNHDAANQRLSAIQGTTTVKCWLDECHANASDITSAWDLDSLLVKPTQRVAKYPMLLQQLLETTPAEHPDHDDLKTASKDVIAMLTRINDAKKRADLVEQIISRKSRKESDVRSGIAKAFGRRTEKLKERVGMAEAFQDPEFDELAHKFGGHFIRLQICMRDVQDYVQRADKAIELINNYAASLELFIDVRDSHQAEVVSKWRRYGQIIRELTLVSFGEHKADVQKRVLAPMIQCIKLHEGPQNAIAKRKKRIVDFAKCKSEERRGQKPDKKTVEASEAYVALNETLKIELPQLYSFTAQLVQKCLLCFLDIQLKWHNAWEKKLRPVLEASDIPSRIDDIEPAFRPDYAEVEKELSHLSICNGALKVEAASFLSPRWDSTDDMSAPNGRRRPSTMESGNRTLSVGSESSTNPNTRRHSGIYTPGSEAHPAPNAGDSRLRSNSSMSGFAPSTQTATSLATANRSWSNSNAATPNSSFSMIRPLTANAPPPGVSATYMPRQSSESQWSPRPDSSATYFTARPDVGDSRYSGMFSSAMPSDATGGAQQRPASPSRNAPQDMNVLFVCASLFEFSIDRTRKEAGYPYLQYVSGEVFDVVAQKGELWLAKNQDDPHNELGWIWEQHFITLSTD